LLLVARGGGVAARGTPTGTVSSHPDSLPIPERTFVVQITNEINRTYFHGSRWREMAERYGMEPGTKCHIYIDGLFGQSTYFYYKQRADSS
jgi:hypothetical protein